jgi:hypothetical protein
MRNHTIFNPNGSYSKRALIRTLRTSPVAAIIPAYNEAGRIGNVLAVLQHVERLTEIIVVDDGSSDETGDVASQAARSDWRVRVVRHPVNRGKGEAIMTGWRAACSPVLLLLDADLINLLPEQVLALMEPVLRGEADMTLGLFQGGYWRTDLSHRLTPWLSGQRCLRAELMAQLPIEAAAGYGFETALSMAAQQGRWSCVNVPLVGVTHIPGDVPTGGWRGPANKVRQYSQIVRAGWLALPRETILQGALRRGRAGLVLLLALGFSLVNSCSPQLTALENRLLLSRWLSDDTFWLFVGKLKAVINQIP